MVRVRDLSPDDAPSPTDLYGEYGRWADRDVEGVRRALADTDVAVGVEDGATSSPRHGSRPTPPTTRTSSTWSSPPTVAARGSAGP